MPKGFTKKIKELTPRESMDAVKALLKRKRKMSNKDLKPGHLIFSIYNAKFKEFTYDRTPLVLILRRNSQYTLGLNFHWIPFSMRVNLAKKILDMNAAQIRQRKPLKFSYDELKPMMKSLGYAPCIRLYINSRFSKTGVVIPAYKLMEIARLKTETFTEGRYSAGQLFAMARKRGRAKEPLTKKQRRKKRR
jgi:hypothetical protein